MKIKVKSSGEVYYADYWENRDVRIDEAEIKGTVDWDAFRREAAKDFMSAIITREAPQYNFACRNVADRVTEAIMWADELIKQLKEEKA